MTYKTFDLFLIIKQFLIKVYIMNNDLNNISAKRYMLIRNILDSSENKKFYNEMDALLLKKYFDNAYETSLL